VIIDNYKESNINILKNKINSISDGKASQICIFGVGKLGIELFNELRERLINVDFFCDNNPEKEGYIFYNKYCISFEQLRKIKEDVLVIIASEVYSNEIKQQLIDFNFKYVVTKSEISKLVKDVPPLEWFSYLSNIDYSSKEMELLISKFKDVICDICNYYESRITTNKNEVNFY